MMMTTSEQWKIWSKVAAQSFGGPAGQIAVIHRIVVDEKKIVSEERFLHALNFCMLLPGPEAQQLATYMGWLINGWRGGLLAGGLFILPGFLSILALSYVYVLFHDISWVQGIFFGLKPAIIAIVAAALLRISRRTLKTSFHWAIAAMAFLSLFIFNVRFPLVILASAIFGVIHHYLVKQENFQRTEPIPVPSLKPSMFTFCAWLTIWFLPGAVVFLAFGETSTFHSLDVFFSKMSMVTFGGAYAALNYVAQMAVEHFHWLQGREMLDGLAMAETTPGPLIQSVQFVGFMAAYRFPDFSSPLWCAFIGSLLTTWMTFAPCFLWIFTFAPYVEYLRGQRILAASLEAITSSVVGVILNLSLWFAMHSLFSEVKVIQSGWLDLKLPELASLDFRALLICALALILQFMFRRSLFFIIGSCALVGVLMTF